MNFLKDSWLHWKEFSLTTSAEERIVVRDDKIQVKGNIHRMLPTNYSSWLSGALVASANSDTDRTNFFIYVGGMKIPIVQSMTLHPNLDIALEEDHDCSISLNARDGKHLMIRLASSSSFQQWHQALCEALAELIFTQAFLFTAAGALSAQRLEVAMRRATRLVPSANCHWLRAKRLWNIKVELIEILRRLDLDILSVTRDHVRNFIANSQVDRLVMQDSDFVRLQSLEPSLFWAAELASEDGLQNVTLHDPFQRLVHAPSILQDSEMCGDSDERARRRLCSPASSLPLSLRPTASPVVWSNTSVTALLPVVGDGLQSLEESDVHWELCSPDRHDASPPAASPSRPASPPRGEAATQDSEGEGGGEEEQGAFLQQLEDMIGRLDALSPCHSPRGAAPSPSPAARSLGPPPAAFPRRALAARSPPSPITPSDSPENVAGNQATRYVPSPSPSPGAAPHKSSAAAGAGHAGTPLSPLLVRCLPSPGDVPADRAAGQLAVLEQAEDVVWSASQRHAVRDGLRPALSPLSVLVHRHMDKTRGASRPAWTLRGGRVWVVCLAVLAVVVCVWTAHLSPERAAGLAPALEAAVGLRTVDDLPSPSSWAGTEASPAVPAGLPAPPVAGLSGDVALSEAASLVPAAAKAGAVQTARRPASLREVLRQSWRRATAWVHSPLHKTWTQLARGLKRAAAGTLRVLTLMPARHQEVLLDPW